MIFILLISTIKFAMLTNGISIENATNFAVSRLLLEQENQQIRMCSCSEVKLCENLGRAEVEFCIKKCQSHLSSFGNFSEIQNCFVETQQELEIWSNCIKKSENL
jgi:hypothetical protein